MAEQRIIYRGTTFFKRRSDISEEQFYHHWEKVHGPLCVPWAIKHGVLGYVQFHTPAEVKMKWVEGMLPEFKGDLDFDAAADWYFEDYKAYLAAYEDPYYKDVINPDEDNFIDKHNKTTALQTFSTMGYNKPIITDGKPAVHITDDIMKRWEEYQAREKSS